MSVVLHIPWTELVQLLTLWHVAKEIKHNQKQIYMYSNNALLPQKRGVLEGV